jgi:HK97 family phage major capsid protein
MKFALTVLPFMVSVIVAFAAMPTDVYQICQRRVGTLKVEPWLSRASSGIRDAIASIGLLAALMRFAGNRTVMLTGAALLALLVADLQGLHAATGVALIGIAGETATEPTLTDVKKAIESSNQIFEGQFKEVNDKIKALEAAGKAVDPLLTEKLEKLSKALDDQSKVNENFIAFQAKAQRQLLSATEDTDRSDKRAAELKLFNGAVRALAAANGRQAPAELDQAGYDAYRSALDQYLRRGDRHFTDVERRALSVGVDTEGGFLVTPDKTGRMIERVFETSPMRQYSSVQAIGTDTLEGTADLDEATCGWVGETGTRSESTTAQVPAPWRIPVHEIYAEPRATQKLLEDANIDVAAWHGKKVADKIGRTTNAAFVTGNGVSKPRGFATYDTEATADTSRAWGKFEHIVTGTSGGFGTDPNAINKLLDLIHTMKDVYVAQGAFYLNRTTLGKVRQLTDASSAGKYVFIPSFVAGMPDTLLGYPIRKLQDMATYSTASALAVAFGDMKETYQIVDRLGVTVLVDPYTAKPYVKFYTRARVGGDVVNFESLKFLKFST